MTEIDDSVKRSRELGLREARAGGPDALVASLEAGLSRQRRTLKIVIVSLVVDLALSIGLVIALILSSGASDKASQNATDAIRVCQDGNAARATAARLWENVLDTVFPVPATPAVAAEHERLLDFVHAAYDQRKC